MWKFCVKAQFQHSFGQIARNYAETVPLDCARKLGEITVFCAVWGNNHVLSLADILHEFVKTCSFTLHRLYEKMLFFLWLILKSAFLPTCTHYALIPTCFIWFLTAKRYFEKFLINIPYTNTLLVTHISYIYLMW